MDRDKFKAVPTSALYFGAEMDYGDNGDEAKTVPIKMLARSAQEITHWFWGRVVHDMAGFSTHKNRLCIDYCHDDKEIIGYLNKFDATNDGLSVSGALTPVKDDDRASDIIAKSKAGVPYEASINFSDDMTIQIVDEGEQTPVNGFDFAGPGIVIREWGLRGVAVCPYGADKNTDSQLQFTDKDNKTFSPTIQNDIITIDDKKDTDMTDKTNDIDNLNDSSDSATGIADAVEAEGSETDAVDTEATEVITEAVDVEAEVNETVEAEATEMSDADEPTEATKFADIMAQLEALKAENKKLSESIEELTKGADPVVFDEAPEQTKTNFVDLFKKANR